MNMDTIKNKFAASKLWILLLALLAALFVLIGFAAAADADDALPDEDVSQSAGETDPEDAEPEDPGVTEEPGPELFTGFIQENGSWQYYEDDVKSNATSVVSGTINGIDGKWYIENGKAKLDYTGLSNVAGEDGNWWYIKNGQADVSHNGVDQNDYGWWYVTGGKVQFGYTGVADYANDYGWWYVKDGKVDFSKNSVEQNSYGWWYVLGGKVQFGYTGVANYANDYGWWYIKDGQVDFSCNSVECNDFGWWYVLGGKVNFSYTGVADYSNAYGWWYISGGKVDFSKNSVEQNQYGWWYVLGGQVNFNYTGVANYGNDYGWWYIKNGKVDFSKNSVEKNSNGWWYVVGGKVQFGYTGVSNYSNDYGWWYIRDGQVNFMFIGIAKNDYGWWYVFNGKVTFTNSEGVAAAVATAATLGDDLQSIRDFVRYDIRYSNSWGGDDSIAYGLTNLSGNCYVHAICLKALLDVKGYTANLIWTKGMETDWVTGDGHFWVQVLTEDGWRHMDGTPSSSGIYDRYLLMTDSQRQETLLGGTWDHSLWPACN